MKLPNLTTLEKATELIHQSLSPTPQIHWPLLSQRTGAEVYVKHENHTPIGAFKIRGGLYYMKNLNKDKISEVVAATRGNHGQSIALSAGINGLKAKIVVPKGNSPSKNAAMVGLGADLIEYGEDFQEALEYSVTLVNSNRTKSIPSFDMNLVIGVATYGIEFFRSINDLHTVYVPIGLGSGICGLISARNALNLSTRIVGVVSNNADTYAKSFTAGKPINTDTAQTLADGIACRVPVPEALQIILGGAERIVRVSDKQILDAMGYYLTDTHNLSEGAGAAPLAALLKEKREMKSKKVGLILSGGNADPSLLISTLDRYKERYN